MQDSELEYFKEMLESRKEQINKNISGVNSELDELSKLELNDEGDHASVNNNSMVESAIVTQQTKELGEIMTALTKISTKEYGVCEMSEESIGFQRLKVTVYPPQRHYQRQLLLHRTRAFWYLQNDCCRHTIRLSSSDLRIGRYSNQTGLALKCQCVWNRQYT